MRRLARAWLYLGTAAVVLGLGRVHAQYIGHYVFHSSFRFQWSLGYILLLCLAAYGLGLPDLVRNASGALAAALVATVAATLGISVAQLVMGSAVLPRFVLFGSVGLLVPGYALCAFIAAHGRRRARSRDRVVAVIGPEEAAALAVELARAPERGASLVEVVTVAEACITEDGRRPLVSLVEQVGASMLVLDRAGQADESVVEQAAELHESGAVRVRTLALFYDEWLGKLPVSELERISLMFDISELHEARYGRMKRLADVCGAVVGTLVLVVLLPFVLIGNLLANRGPLFYRQPRCGKNGVEFQIVKLRTMRPGEDSSWTEEADERVTPFGAWLRRAHLDELPQVWNVLRGDLSCIGPRPEQPHYVAELSAKIPFYQLRHLVRPGLTGWAQVSYSYGSSEFDALEKLQYEFYYLRHQGLALDARIIGRTLRSVMRLGGR